MNSNGAPPFESTRVLPYASVELGVPDQPPREHVAVEGLVVERPGFKLLLKRGVLSREDLELPGGSRGYFFTGEAEVDCSVQDPMERLYFSRFADKEEWRTLPLTDVYILPTGSADPLEGNYSGAPGEVARLEVRGRR